MKELSLSWEARIKDLHLQIGEKVKVAGHVYRYAGHYREGGKVYDVLEPVD